MDILIRLLPIAMFAFIAGCAGNVELKPDHAARADHVVSVYWHKAHSLKEAGDLCIDKYKVSTRPLIGVVRGCYIVVNDVCTIVAIDSEQELFAVGHEFKHCIDGLWHNKDGFPKDGVFLAQ